MKQILLAIGLQIVLFAPVVAQNKSDLKTDNIKVEGVCNSCKKRIEAAAYIPGVKQASWEKTSGILTVTYKSSKTDPNTISKAIAAKGHSTEAVKADRSTYEKLPACCAYESNHKH